MNNVATRAAWTAPRALTVNQLFSSEWKDSNPCKYKTPSTACSRWGGWEGGMEGRVSNLTFDPTNKKHVSFRIALQRGGSCGRMSFFCNPRSLRLIDRGRGGSVVLHKTWRKTEPQRRNEKDHKQTMLIIDYQWHKCCQGKKSLLILSVLEIKNNYLTHKALFFSPWQFVCFLYYSLPHPQMLLKIIITQH